MDRLGNHIEITNGYAFKSSKYSEDGARVIRITNVQKGIIEDNNPKYYALTDLEKLERYEINNDDILMSLTGNVGRVGRFPSELLPAYINQRVCRVKSKSDKLNDNYLFHILNSNEFEERAINSSTGIAQLNLSTKWIEEFKIPLPPLKTQKQIASILDNAAALRDKTAQLLKEYDLLAQSIFLEMFGDPVVDGKGWKIKKLIDVSNQITDGTHHSPKPVKEGFPYVTAKHIKKMSLDFDSKPTYVDKQAHEEIYSRCKPEYQDVFLIKDGATTGVACLNSFKEPISLLSSVGLIKPDKEVLNPVFLVFWFNHSGVKEQLIRKFMSGAAIKRYTISKMKKFKIIVPPINLQNEFAEKIDLIEKQKALAKQELQESEDLFNCLLQKAFKGELV